MQENAQLRSGSLLMAITGAAFVGYGVVFLIWNFVGGGFELGVETINGVTRAQLHTFEPAVLHYIGHLHVATAAFIVSTGVAVAALAWYGVRRGELWAWTAAVAASVIGLALALPMHYLDLFSHDWVTHLGPIYLATILFVAGALLALQGIRSAGRSASASRQTALSASRP